MGIPVYGSMYGLYMSIFCTYGICTGIYSTGFDGICIYIRILVGFKRIYTRIYLCVCTYEKYVYIYIWSIKHTYIWTIPNFVWSTFVVVVVVAIIIIIIIIITITIIIINNIIRHYPPIPPHCLGFGVSCRDIFWSVLPIITIITVHQTKKYLPWDTPLHLLTIICGDLPRSLLQPFVWWPILDTLQKNIARHDVFLICGRILGKPTSCTGRSEFSVRCLIQIILSVRGGDTPF